VTATAVCTILYHPLPFFTILYHSSPFFTILYHPSPFFTILHHPSSSFIILQHLSHDDVEQLTWHIRGSRRFWPFALPSHLSFRRPHPPIPTPFNEIAPLAHLSIRQPIDVLL